MRRSTSFSSSGKTASRGAFCQSLGWREIATMSSWRVIAQNGTSESRSVQYTGASRRSRAHSACG
jgi:hypothetical protein